MCGILCMFNTKDSTFLKSLSELENRGYESCGMLCVKESKRKVLRQVSKDKSYAMDMMKKLMNNKVYDVILGHTRWPTNGVSSVENCHPLEYKNVFIVHNGIINSNLLKEKCKYADVKSETDSVWIAVTYRFFRELHKPYEAFRHTVTCLRGFYAIILIDMDFPDRIFVSCKDMSLVIGSDLTISSEPTTLICKTYAPLKNGETFMIKDGMIHTGTQSKPYSKYFKNRKCNVIKNKISELKYETRTEQEIWEQGEILMQTLPEIVNLASNIIFIGAGSSFHAASFLHRYLLQQHKVLSSRVINACDYLIEEINDVIGDVSLIVLSQSGESKDTLECYENIQRVLRGRERKLSVIGMTNVSHSKLDRICDYTVHLNCGKEYGVAATKSFTTQITLGMQLLDFSVTKLIPKWALRLPSAIQHLSQEAENLTQKYFNQKEVFPNILILGKAESISLANEASLKISELANIPAFVQPMNGLKHGYLSLLDPSWLVFLIYTNDCDCDNTWNELKANSIPHLLLTESYDEKMALLEVPSIRIHCQNRWLSAVHVVIFFQWLAFFLAQQNNKSIDRPRHLCKTVAV